MFSNEKLETDDLWSDLELVEKDITEGYWMLSTVRWPDWYVYIAYDYWGNLEGWRWGDPGP